MSFLDMFSNHSGGLNNAGKGLRGQGLNSYWQWLQNAYGPEAYNRSMGRYVEDLQSQYADKAGQQASYLRSAGQDGQPQLGNTYARDIARQGVDTRNYMSEGMGRGLQEYNSLVQGYLPSYMTQGHQGLLGKGLDLGAGLASAGVFGQHHNPGTQQPSGGGTGGNQALPYTPSAQGWNFGVDPMQPKSFQAQHPQQQGGSLNYAPQMVNSQQTPSYGLSYGRQRQMGQGPRGRQNMPHLNYSPQQWGI